MCWPGHDRGRGGAARVRSVVAARQDLAEVAAGHVVTAVARIPAGQGRADDRILAQRNPEGAPHRSARDAPDPGRRREEGQGRKVGRGHRVLPAATADLAPSRRVSVREIRDLALLRAHQQNLYVSPTQPLTVKDVT